MARPCKTCDAPTPIRDLVERLRTAGVSHRDAAQVIKIVRGYDISHAAIQRHEVEGHFDVNAVLASQVGAINPEELTLANITRHKVQLWWAAHRDEVPNSNEVRAWFKLMADLSEAESEREKTNMLKAMFRRETPAIEAPKDIIEVTVLEERN